MAGEQDQKSSNFYSRLTRGRSKPNLKSVSLTKDGIKGSAISSKPGTPSLSLPTNFGGTDQHDLQGEDGISKWMVEDAPSKSSAASGADAKAGVAERHVRSDTTDSIARTHDIANFTARQSLDTTTISDLQAKLLQEMKEKGELITRYETLSSQHLALQKEASAARLRAGSASTVTAPGVVAAASEFDASRAPSTAAAGAGSTSRLHTAAPSIAPSTHAAAAFAADDVFREEMNRCAVSVYNWVASNWSDGKLDFAKAASKSKEAEQAASAENSDSAAAKALDKSSRRDVLAEIANIAGNDYKTVAAHSTMYFLVALVTARLMEIFDDDFFFGLPSLDDGTDLAALRQSLRLLKASAPEAALSADVNTWRAHTAILLRKLAETSAELRTHTEQLAFGLASSIDGLLVSITSAEPSPARREQLRSILLRVIELARLFRAQLASFEFELPSMAKGDVAFNKDTMVEAGETSGSAKTSQKVQLATWPSVVRVGDAAGGNDSSRTIVSKAQVVLADEA